MTSPHSVCDATLSWFPPLWLFLLNLCQFFCLKLPCPLFSGFCRDLVSIHHPSYLLQARSLNPTASMTIFDDPQILSSSLDFSLKLWTQRLSNLLDYAAGSLHGTQHHQNVHLFWVSFSGRPPQPPNLPARGLCLRFHPPFLSAASQPHGQFTRPPGLLSHQHLFSFSQSHPGANAPLPSRLLPWTHCPQFYSLQYRRQRKLSKLPTRGGSSQVEAFPWLFMLKGQVPSPSSG